MELGTFDALPAISGDPDAAKLLGMRPDWVEVLEKKGHLKSLGGRTRGCQRFYATQYLVGLRKNQEWLDKAVRIIRQHFHDKNSRQSSN